MAPIHTPSVSLRGVVNQTSAVKDVVEVLDVNAARMQSVLKVLSRCLDQTSHFPAYALVLRYKEKVKSGCTWTEDTKSFFPTRSWPYAVSLTEQKAAQAMRMTPPFIMEVISPLNQYEDLKVVTRAQADDWTSAYYAVPDQSVDLRALSGI